MNFAVNCILYFNYFNLIDFSTVFDSRHHYYHHFIIVFKLIVTIIHYFITIVFTITLHHQLKTISCYSLYH